MLGFLIGAACLFGLIKMARQGRRFGRWGGHGRWGGSGWGRRGFLNRIFMRLETSPSQENLIVGAVDEVRSAAKALRPEFESSRSDLARVLADETFDQERLNAVFARHDEAIRTMRESVTSSLGKIHGALDSEQRKKLAEMLEYRFGFGRRGGPYRNAAVHI
jgi:Spy/CpxP family protein refolding chaperone